MSTLFDDRQCTLGEGPLWHPERSQLFWFDILNRQLLSRENGAPRSWQFDEYVSAAGWVSRNELLIASQTQLFLFDLETEESQKLCDLEADKAITRSNDGRADPKGGFWIGTMGIQAEPGAGAIYRYYKGELRKLYGDITISNAICFAPDGSTACFSDTARQTIQKVALDADGWPAGDPELFVDLGPEDLKPDGAVIDSEGHLWNAQWGANRVARYAPDGSFVEAISFPAKQVSCPAFGGAELATLYATTAAEGLDGEDEGKTYSADASARGQLEHRVVL
ncbi:SMP-30/gluconolactonase/LRE family protein [Roseibium sediminicola]|uniref:SMP-30/gluconolactonase/LRE family protein n=1 Tax=Roseibium sediminicola TaxID=2933272 RepID=A0ABT0GTT7_9HYPH|nr:SMP-30/gluconolactonase/LRE family protein [Roseibium sp. CAU 1639]MCK7612841.1 SMP-30/gluconolactonase/LRE family protein [Roseibium sp. CAU 1639]